MATKERDSIQEERIQNVSAPRVVPGAAHITIPRRDLLAGTALVLVGSISGCGKGTSGCGTGKQQLRTQFMADFTAEFIGDPKTIMDPGPPPQTDPWPEPRLWPVSGQTQSDIVTDFATFANVLMTVGYVMAPPPAATSGSLGDRIGKFLTAQNWPTATTVPPEYKKELPTVHLVEIAVILDRLLQAINSFGKGPGGGGSNWPPH